MKQKRGPRISVRCTSFDHPKCDLNGFIDKLTLSHAMHVIVPKPRSAQTGAMLEVPLLMRDFHGLLEANTMTRPTNFK
jgi:hypothetical protein